MSGKYKGLRVSSAVGDVKFVDGVAEVSEAQSEVLRNLSADFGVTVESKLPDPVIPAPPIEPAPPVDNEHVAPGAELFEPKGNAALDEWQAYAVQKGIPAENVADLKREEIKQLLAEK